MRILIFSRIRLFSESLADSLRDCDEGTDVAACGFAERLKAEARKFRPDIVLFDIAGDQALSQARALSEACPGTPMLALAVPKVPEEIISCVDAGFVGYVPLEASLVELSEAVRLALKGECVCDPKVTGTLLREVRRRRERAPEPDLGKQLTNRECEVLCLLARGLSNKEIARELVVSVCTVKNHLHSVFTKLRVKGRTEALVRMKNEPWLARSA